jgi:hypothetical protein
MIRFWTGSPLVFTSLESALVPSPDLDRRLVRYPDAVPYKDRQQRDRDADERGPDEDQTKPVCSITKPENPARMLPGKAQSEVSRPNWLAACSTDASVDNPTTSLGSKSLSFPMMLPVTPALWLPAACRSRPAKTCARSGSSRTTSRLGEGWGKGETQSGGKPRKTAESVCVSPSGKHLILRHLDAR